MQTTLSVSLEVAPENCRRLGSLIDQLHDRRSPGAAAGATSYATYMAAVPTLHFMSLSVFASPDYDPLFVIEANFDGAAGPFWAHLDAAIGDDLRDMIRCCKRPRNGDGALYDAVAGTESRVSAAPLLERRASRPSVYHHGNRGLPRAQIVTEGALFADIRAEIARAAAQTPDPYRTATAPQVHHALRTSLLVAHPWLAGAATPRIPLVERASDFIRLAAYALFLMLVLSVPGLIAARLLPHSRYVIAVAIAASGVAFGLYRLRAPLEGTGTPTRFNLLSAIFGNLPLIGLLLAIYLATVGSAAVVGDWLLFGTPWQAAVRSSFGIVLLALLTTLLVVLPGLALWLRWLELRDSSFDAPQIDPEIMRQMAQREDWLPQNHMGSIVLLRPGVLRTLIVHAGHRALHLLLRFKITDGYLGSMRTIHFAHWAFVNNGARLMFHSNFDQSWETYLDDFIEKAHEGLTLAWGCGAGFPPTRFLIQDGASHGRQFKAWARHSMAVSRFWYSAYPDLTVDQIERNNRIANGLRREHLSEKEAPLWMLDL